MKSMHYCVVDGAVPEVPPTTDRYTILEGVTFCVFQRAHFLRVYGRVSPVNIPLLVAEELSNPTK